MKYGKNTNKYIEMIFSEMENSLQATATPEITATVNQSIINTIYNIEKPRKVKKIEHSKKTDHTANTLFRPLSEIINTIEIIELIPTFINTFPYKRKGISEIKYFQYHIGNYFVEIGNLYYRLIEYLGIIKNTYRKILKDRQRIELISGKLKKYIERRFANTNIINIRDKHVHHFRYTDKELDRLAALDILRLSKNEEFKKECFIDIFHKDAFNKIRRKWKKQIKEINDMIEQILEVYFGTLLMIVTPKDSVIYPFK